MDDEESKGEPLSGESDSEKDSIEDEDEGLAPLDQRCALNLFLEPLDEGAEGHFTVKLQDLLNAAPHLNEDLQAKCAVECTDP